MRPLSRRCSLALSHQIPVNSVALGTPSTVAAWHVKPTYYAVSSEDLMIPSQAEQMFAQRMGAKKTITLKSSHVSMLSHPNEIADLIVEATQAK